MTTVNDIANMSIDDWFKADFSSIKSDQIDEFISETISLFERNYATGWRSGQRGTLISECLKAEAEAIKESHRNNSPIGRYMGKFKVFFKGKSSDIGEEKFDCGQLKKAVSDINNILKESYNVDIYEELAIRFDLDHKKLRDIEIYPEIIIPNSQEELQDISQPAVGTITIGDDPVITPDEQHTGNFGENYTDVNTLFAVVGGIIDSRKETDENWNKVSRDAIEKCLYVPLYNRINAGESVTPEDVKNARNAINDILQQDKTEDELLDDLGKQFNFEPDLFVRLEENDEHIDTPEENPDEIDSVAKWEAKYMRDDLELSTDDEIKQCIDDTIKAFKTEKPDWDKVSEEALRVLLEEEFKEIIGKYNVLKKTDVMTPVEQISSILSSDKSEEELLEALANDFSVDVATLPKKPIAINEGDTNEEENHNEDRSWILKKHEYYQGLVDAGQIENYVFDSTKPGFYAEFNNAYVHYTSEHTVNVSKGADIKVFNTILDDPANGNRPILISSEASEEFKAKLYAACVLKGKVIAEPAPSINPELIDSLNLSDADKNRIKDAINNGYRAPERSSEEHTDSPTDEHDTEPKYRADAPEIVKNTVDKIEELRAQFNQLLQDGRIEVVKIDGKRDIQGADPEDVKKAKELLKEAAEITQNGLNKNAGKRVKWSFDRMATDKNGNLKRDKDGNVVMKRASINTGILDTVEKQADNTSIREAQKRFFDTIRQGERP